MLDYSLFIVNVICFVIQVNYIILKILGAHETLDGIDCERIVIFFSFEEINWERIVIPPYSISSQF
jgi:hypothetical protein